MATTQQQAISGVDPAVATETTEREQPQDGVRMYQSMVLDELPGAAFAAITLVWIFASFGKLAL
jgi:hypothetical protein